MPPVLQGPDKVACLTYLPDSTAAALVSITSCLCSSLSHGQLQVISQAACQERGACAWTATLQARVVLST